MRTRRARDSKLDDGTIYYERWRARVGKKGDGGGGGVGFVREGRGTAHPHRVSRNFVVAHRPMCCLRSVQRLIA